MTNNKPIFKINGLKKYFPLKKKSIFSKEQLYVRANDGIDLTIYEGETLGIVGESGCGKSTFGRTVLQLYDQTDGSTVYYGQSIEDVAPQYIIDILKDLPKAINRFEANRKVRRELREKLEIDPENKKLQEQLNETEKKIDEYFDNTVKIFGALSLSDNLSEVSETYLKWFTKAQESLKIQKKIKKLTTEFNSLNDSDDKTSAKFVQFDKKRAELQNQVDKLEKEEEIIRKEISELKNGVKDNPKYEKYEERRDSGVELNKLKKEEMRQMRQDMQIIFQDPYSSLDPRLTVGQIISEGLVAHGGFKEGSEKLETYVLEIMEKCGLSPYMIHRYAHQFSGGQRQRIGIARALALNPKVIVCDEAVSALDVSIQSQVINLLKDLKEERNLTYLFITHDLSVVKYISDRICVMYLGNVVELATTDRIFEHTAHPYTEALLSAIPTIDDNKREMVLLEGDIPSPIKPPKGCKFHTRCKYCMDICKVETPELKEIAPGHFAACHLKKD
ncbi:MAG: oligopeptide/dipeptide ABC transporter ATP-binding protein [Anaerorhabdus sp.]